jgi:hypothetical protein
MPEDHSDDVQFYCDPRTGKPYIVDKDALTRYELALLVELVKREEGELKEDMRRCDLEMQHTPTGFIDNSEMEALQARWMLKRTAYGTLYVMRGKLEKIMESLPLASFPTT